MALPFWIESARSLVEDTVNRVSVNQPGRRERKRRDRSLQLSTLESRLMFSATPLDAINLQPNESLDGFTQHGALEPPALGNHANPGLQPAAADTQAHRQHTAPNLVPDPTAHTPNGTNPGVWNAYPSISDIVYDANVSRTADGSGSWKLQTPFGQSKYSQIMTEFIEVPETGYYTYGFFAKTDNVPNLYGAQLKLYNSSYSFVKNEALIPYGGVSEANKWEEVVSTGYIDVTETPYAIIQVFKRDNPLGTGTVHVDDFYFGAGEPSFEQPPTENVAFNGDRVQVDKLGNFTVNGEAFFPWMMHVRSSRTDLSVYTDQGWNTNIWASNDAVVQKYEDGGMFSMVKVANYIQDFSPEYNDIARLNSRLQEIIDNNNLSNVIGYYWDNEEAHSEWQVPIDVINAVRAHDQGAPIYALQGNIHVARTFASHGLVDVSGSYVGGVPDDPGSTGLVNFTVLNNIEGNNRPSSVAQINGANSHPGEFRMRVYNSLIEGARAIGYFADGVQVHPNVEDAAWAADMPALPNEIEALMPLIRQPHWTDWSVTGNTSGHVRIGSRELDGVGYLFLSNQNSTTANIEIDLSDVPYEVTRVVDELTGSEVGTINNGKVTLNLAGIGIGSGTQVLRLEPAGGGGGQTNQVPVAANSSVSTPEDTSYSFSPSDFNYTDAEGDALASITVSNLQLGGGTLMLGGTTVTNGMTIASSAISNLVYTPATGVNGGAIASFHFTANDASGNGTSPATMSVDVTSVNSAPIAANDNFTTHIGGTVNGTVATNDSDGDGDTLTFSLQGQPRDGNVVMGSDGAFTYTPNSGYSGRESFSYRVQDGNGGQATAVVTIEVGRISHHGIVGGLQQIVPIENIDVVEEIDVVENEVTSVEPGEESETKELNSREVAAITVTEDSTAAGTKETADAASARPEPTNGNTALPPTTGATRESVFSRRAADRRLKLEPLKLNEPTSVVSEHEDAPKAIDRSRSVRRRSTQFSVGPAAVQPVESVQERNQETHSTAQNPQTTLVGQTNQESKRALPKIDVPDNFAFQLHESARARRAAQIFGSVVIVNAAASTGYSGGQPAASGFSFHRWARRRFSV